MNWIRAVCLGLLVAGCTQHGRDFDESRAASFVKGKTTYAEVVRSLGEPNGTMRRGDGSYTITYSVHKMNMTKALIPIVGPFLLDVTEDSQYKFMHVHFDKENVLTDWILNQP